MKHYSYPYSYAPSIPSLSGGSTWTEYNAYVAGKNNVSDYQWTSHNALLDSKHNPDALSENVLSWFDLNESERDYNIQPWMCTDSPIKNRTFCMAWTGTSSWIYTASTPGLPPESAVIWGAEYQSGREYDMPQFGTPTNFRNSTAQTIPTTRSRLIRNVNPMLTPGEVTYNILYVGSDQYDRKIQMIYPDASNSLTQGYLLLPDDGKIF
jgi:hypothetical protein